MPDRVGAFGGALAAAVYLPDDYAGELRLADATGAPDVRQRFDERCPRGSGHPVAQAFRDGRPVWNADASVPAALPLGGGESGEGGRVIRPGGVLALYTHDPLVGAPARRVLLELYADHIAERLGAAGQPEPLPQPARVLETQGIGWFSMELSTGRVEVSPVTLDLVGVLPGAFDGRVESLLAHTVAEDLPALMSIVEPWPIATNATRQLEFRVRMSSGELRWLHMRCRVPLDEADRPEHVLGLLADAAHLRPSADEVSRVQRLSATLATAVTVRDVSEMAVAALRELGADRVVLGVLEGDRLVITAFHPAEPDVWPEQWRESWPEAPATALPTLTEALREGTTSLWTSGTTLEPGLADIGPGGMAVLPLLADARVVGACLAGWRSPHEFGAEERFLLSATARLVGQATMRARAFDAQHELAEMLQRTLLPRTLPELPGGEAEARYLPATVGLDVGGDWYDVIPLTDRHVAFVIGDVQGHSAAAATIMGQIRTAIRAYAVEGHSPDVVISHANRLLTGMETDLFATCCYVAMDMEEGDTWFVRAGHLPPLLRDPDGATREIEVEGGPPLGVVPEADFPMTTMGLSAGTVLLLLTDGLVESATLPVEEGLARVRETLGATPAGDAGALADALLGGSDRRDDDVALLLLRYDGMRVKPRRAGWEVWRLPDAVGHARRFTARTLRSWGVREDADAVLLAVSELVTNALVHTQGPVRLDLTQTGDRLRVAVSDSSPRTPVKDSSGDWEATGGRGIMLVEAVSLAWGSVPLSGGKQVWCEIALARPPGEELETAAS